MAKLFRFAYFVRGQWFGLFEIAFWLRFDTVEGIGSCAYSEGPIYSRFGELHIKPDGYFTSNIFQETF